VVTTTISSKGQVVIPRPVRERHKMRPGDDFLVFELSNGDIVLRHASKPRKSLIWHLRRLKGLRIERPRESVREVNW
jgi:AbrB family looped-hinge helix DNA binding protein